MQDVPVIDFHAHLGNWGRFGMLDTPELFLKCMDNAGIDVTCLNCIFHGDSDRGNVRVADYVRRWPKRFVGAAFVSANYPEEMVPELERCFGTLGMKFIKIYPHYVGVAHDDPPLLPHLRVRRRPGPGDHVPLQALLRPAFGLRLQALRGLGEAIPSNQLGDGPRRRREE